MTIYDIIHSVWRNYPRNASTMSRCECGRSHRRGGEPCLVCLTEKLTDLGVPLSDVTDWFEAIDDVRRTERKIVDLVNHG